MTAETDYGEGAVYDRQDERRYGGRDDRQDDRRQDGGFDAQFDSGYGARQEPRLSAARAGAASTGSIQWDDYKVRLAISEEPGGSSGRSGTADRMAVRFFAAACALFTLTLFASFLF